MRPELITLIVLLAMIALFAWNKIPLLLTAMLALLTVYFAGILPFSEAFSGFSSNAVIMMIGMSVFGVAFNETGLVSLMTSGISNLMRKREGITDKGFLLIGGLLAILASTFLNGMLVTIIFLDIVDDMARNGCMVTRRNTYIPMSIATTYGNTMTSISSTTIIVTSGLIAQSSVGRPLSFFEPAVIGLPCVLLYFLVFATFGVKWEQHCFRFQESTGVLVREKVEHGEISKPKIAIVLATLLGCIMLFIFTDFNVGAVSMAGAWILFITKCVDVKKCFRSMRWITIVLVACCLGFARAVDISGAGKMIADTLLQLAAPLINGPFSICVIALVTSSLLSNFMNNSSAAAITVPIFVVVAESAGADILPIAIAAGVGANLATATPIASPDMTMTVEAGYRFKDYIRVGGLFNLLALILCAASLYICYYI